MAVRTQLPLGIPAPDPQPPADKLAGTLAQLEHGIAQLATTPQWVRWLRAQALFHSYSFGNVLLITAQRPDASRVAGFTTWKRLGRGVRRGEHGIRILAPIVIRLDNPDTDTGEAERESERSRVATRFRVVHVFDVSQTDGEPLPASPCRPLVGGAPAGAEQALGGIIGSHGFSIGERAMALGRNGVTHFGERTVTLSDSLSPAQRVKTLAHELGHILLHDPVTGTAVTESCRGEAELEAESVAYIVCRHLGLETDDYSLGYVASWAGGGDEALAGLRRSAGRISTAAGSVIDALDGTATSEEVAA